MMVAWSQSPCHVPCGELAQGTERRAARDGRSDVKTHKAHAVGIDLGTTYSCLAYLNEHDEPVTLANQEGELATPSVVFFDEDQQVVVGTEALRNAIVRPDRVVQNSKRHIGDPSHCWTIDGQDYTPVDIASYVLRKLLTAAHEQIGAVERAVVTVPAQFSELQRRATIEAGHRAGLKQVDIINEAFTPSEEEIAAAQEIVDLFAANPGVGAIGYKGGMLDRPYLARAETVLRLAGRL